MLTMHSWSLPRLRRKEERAEKNREATLKQPENVTSDKNSWRLYPQDPVLQKDKTNLTLSSCLRAQVVLPDLSDPTVTLFSLHLFQVGEERKQEGKSLTNVVQTSQREEDLSLMLPL